MASCPLWTLSLLLALLLPLEVLSQDLLNLADALDNSTKTTPAPHLPLPAAGGEFDLADALDSNNDIGGKGKNKGQGGGAPGGGSDKINQYEDNTETTAEVGTIAGIVSAVAMALVGAISSYISYQKKELCFSLQQSLNTDMVKAENPEAVVATEPQGQVQQTLLEPHNTEAPTEENAV